MSSNPVPAPDSLRTDTVAAERRSRPRLRVHWPLQFCAAAGKPIQTVTHDLSSKGLYCLIETPFVPGEIRECTLLVPARDPADDNRWVSVRCRVRVVRVEAPPETGLYGVACRIEDYQLVGVPSDQWGAAEPFECAPESGIPLKP